MKVICDNYDCAFEKYGVCTQNQIWLENLECQDYIHYSEILENEYVHSYYKAIKTKEGAIAKALCDRGKKIEYKGIILYTQSKIYDNDDDFWATEETTGMGVSLEKLKNRYHLAMKYINEAPKVKYLPLAKKNENDEWVLVESEGKE